MRMTKTKEWSGTRGMIIERRNMTKCKQNMDKSKFELERNKIDCKLTGHLVRVKENIRMKKILKLVKEGI